MVSEIHAALNWELKVLQNMQIISVASRSQAAKNGFATAAGFKYRCVLDNFALFHNSECLTKEYLFKRDVVG